jgi:N utilization substance protein B
MSESEPVPPLARGGGRHRAREVALQVLYAIDLRAGGREPRNHDPETAGAATGSVLRGEEVFDRIAENFVVPDSATEFARELVVAVLDRSAELDVLLGTHAKNWRVARMAAVDRNVLRMAVYELRDTRTPVAVVIDEAVDLARRFGSDSSPSFVNGVLDAVAREVRAA